MVMAERTETAVNLMMPVKLKAALSRYLEETRPQPLLKSAIIVAVEEFLAARGFWPERKAK